MNLIPSITILTPTYNRAYKLVGLYNSLRYQTDQVFDWVIVDDGSFDNTQELITKWQEEASFNINYIYKLNGGKHTALNLAIEHIQTDLTFVVDSDDSLLDQAIEIIKHDWSMHNNLIGLMYLKAYQDGSLVGSEFLIDNEITSYSKSRLIQKVEGDKAEVWNTSYLKKVPFPEYYGEKFFSEQYVFIQLSSYGDMLALNKMIYYCEYLDDGLSKNIRKLQVTNPKGALINAMALTNKEFGLGRRIKSGIQIVVFSLIAKDQWFKNLRMSSYGLASFLFIIPGIFLYLYYSYKYLRKN